MATFTRRAKRHSNWPKSVGVGNRKDRRGAAAFYRSADGQVKRLRERRDELMKLKDRKPSESCRDRQDEEAQRELERYRDRY